MPIRAALPGDLPALLAMAVDFYAEDGFTTSREDLRANLAHLVASPAARVAVSEEEGRAVAFAITTTSFGLESGPLAELEDLYVVPDARRRGEAERLIEDSLRWAAARGCTAVEIVVAPNGHDVSHLLAYYGRRGFRDEGRRLLTHPLDLRPPVRQAFPAETEG
ncbi:GNAT family N-acetyltransferase [Nonomuraea roseoviolacea]|uniref:Aminoglycoside 6'-N-acetyltransferase I n=2 Tax=Nonomuraea TaxID=83681 RepID=A0ABT1K1I4_9ACTN|nr:GNAT family N-acetyltransferase [Nonomuraea roseoviolacea]MCP2347843.1 aminoglycoside 6'-N-acetyltransferase I [Nonomuraea roseoviolacea subsp. carminata]